MMRSLIRTAIIIVATIVVAIWSIIPPDKKLRLGRDLAGGVSLVYNVQIKPGDPADVVSKVIDVLKKRIDPNGLSEIAMIKQGQDRIEITMPLPNDRVKRLKAAYEAQLESLSTATLDDSAIQRLMRTPTADRDHELARLAEGNAKREATLKDAAAKYDAAQAARAEYTQGKPALDAALAAAQADLKTSTDTNADKARIAELTQKVTDAQARLDEAAGKTADAELAFDAAKKACMVAALSPSEMRRALSLSNEARTVTDSKTGQEVRVPGAQDQALKSLEQKYPDQKAKLDSVLKAYRAFASERAPLDDPADLKRLLAGAGVLDFRITVDIGEHPAESRLRQELRERGPRNVQSTDAHWYRINKLETWYDSTGDLEFIQTNPQAYFQSRRGLIAEQYAGDYYVLCWDAPGSRLTRAEGEWQVNSAYPTTDSRTGLPAIGFEMNARGAGLLPELTGAHLGNKLAVLLDDEVYTAPNLQSKIGKSGQITGSFDDRELNYIINVLAAGSLQAKLSPTPISESRLAPSMGADNLKTSLYTGLIAFALVAAFMVVYYFGSGMIAVVALVVNFVLVLGIMALNHAAFTVPGIAGVVLTFGQAVDSNVLIYERMREEFHRGANMRDAVRLGFSRALSPIVDGNISNLIICAVLYFFGTQEIKGFAITLGVGILTTLFTALVVSRFIFTVLIEYAGWSRTSQLPMAFPIVQKALSPHVDWMKHRWGFLGALVVFLVASAAITVHQGEKLLGTEFRGGTEVKPEFKTNPTTQQPVTLTRKQVQERLAALAAKSDPDIKRLLDESESLPINPQADNVTSDKFKIVFGKFSEPQVVLASITNEFADVMETRVALSFKGVELEDARSAPIHEVVSKTLGESVQEPALREDVGTYMGGGAVMLKDLRPAATLGDLGTRLNEMRQRPEFSHTLARQREVRIIEGNESEVKSAVILVRDESVSSFNNTDRWASEVRDVEWRLTREALTRTGQLASVETFSAAIASTFKAQAVISTLLSLLILTIYVWVRFGAGRWAIAATLPLFADVIGIVGLIALAQLLYENPSTNSLARTLGLLPFKLDLAQVAAVLTIVGYSLNDKIIILDRIRENKGKTPYASYAVVNESINQTMTRTIITAGAHMITTIVLYLWGGEAVRGFAYTFNLGVILGTYTSIVSTPLVWSHANDPTFAKPPPSPPSGPQQTAGSPPLFPA